MDRIRINDNASKRHKDDNGFLIVEDNPIAKAGVFDYLLSEVERDSASSEIVKVCRTFDDLSAKKDYFKGKPIKLSHKWVGSNADSTQADGAIFGEVKAQEPYLLSSIILYNPKLIEAVENGEAVELSPAYDADIVKQDGAYNGEPYAYMQKLVNVNHLAVVENGRSGKDLRILDTKPKGVEMNFKEALKVVMKRFNDEASEEVKQEDSDIAKEILAIAQGEGDEEAKIEAINALLTKGVADEEAETKDEDKTTEVKDEEASDEEVETKDEGEGATPAEVDKIEVKVEELADLVEKIADSKIAKFKDSIAKEAKRVQDTYAEVSKVLGTNFDYSNKSVNDVYRFGYEALTRTKLADSMDAKTAFRVVSGAQKQTRAKVSDSKSTQSNELDAIFKQY